MASPIFYIAPEFTQYSGYFLKAFQSGTTIELPIFIDASETTSVNKLEINSDGFFEYNNNIITPRINGRYDLFLFPDADSADGNQTSIAIRVAQATASEILIGDGGSVEKATEVITGIVKFEGTDDTGGSIIKNITNSRNAVKAVFETLKYTAQDLIDYSDDVWITPSAAYDEILANVIPVEENWEVGQILYKAVDSDRFLKQDGSQFDGTRYPRLAAKSIYKSKNISDITNFVGNVNAITANTNSKPVLVRANDTFYSIVKTGGDITVYSSNDGLTYSFAHISINLFNDVSDDVFFAAYNGADEILMLINSQYATYNIVNGVFSSVLSANDLANPAYLHYNSRLKGYVTFSKNIGIFYCGLINDSDKVYTKQSEFDYTSDGGINKYGALTTGNFGSGDISYALNGAQDGHYILVYNKFSDTLVYEINERKLDDVFNADNNIYNISTGASPLLNGSTNGISADLPLRGAAVVDKDNFAIIDYATDLQTSILVRTDGVFSYKVIDNPFPIDGKSGIIPVGKSKYILTGNNGDGVLFTKDNFDTITSNVTDNSTNIGQVGSGSAIFCNESNKYIIMMKAGTVNQMRYIELDATKVSEYATIDMTSRNLGETNFYVFAGIPE